MKYRICTITLALLSLLFTSLNIQPSKTTAHSSMSDSSETPLQSKSLLPSMGEHITIFFHGLMVARYKPGKTRLEVGIVKERDHHDFKFQVWEGAAVPGIGDARDIDVPEHNVYEFDVVYDNSEATRGGLDVYKPYGARFDRMRRDNDPLGYAQDYQYIPDIEGGGLHNTGQSRRRTPFNRVFQVLKGVLKSKCLTEGIVQKKIFSEDPNAWVDYGYMAEIVGVDITLLPHQQLVLRKKSQPVTDPPVWICSYSQGRYIEARVLNLPEHRLTIFRDATPKVPNDYISLACRTFPNDPHTNPDESHFQYYYKNVLNVAQGKRFVLRMKPDSRKQYYQIRSIFPYKCGMIMQGKTGNDIDEGDVIK